MRHIFPSYAYSDKPRARCWWDETCTGIETPLLETDIETDVAVIGGGFTGLNTALRLARSGVHVTVLEANQIGWGASGRNGGFCCLGGSATDDTLLDKRFGKEGRLEFRNAERLAIAHVENLIDTLELDVDRHSNGETELAHRPKDMVHLRNQCDRIKENYGVTPQIIEQNRLADHGITGPFHGGLTTPLGFALNPRKYVLGLGQATIDAGANVIQNADVTGMRRDESHWRLHVGAHTVKAKTLVIATNGYSSETVPNWLAGRYMPVQSNVIVTRPLTQNEQANQGWSTAQMAFDTRNLLHYFRLMPDGRFLFGMRGGLGASDHTQRRSEHRATRDFQKMFPAWAEVDITHSWSGMVNIARNRLPFVGQIPNMPGVWAGLCYHGNGVAMGSFAGHLLGGLILNENTTPVPHAMTQPLARFPLGAARRLLMVPVYAGLTLGDL